MASRSDPWSVRLGLGVDVATGFHTADPTGGAWLHVSARWRDLSLGLEVRGALPASHADAPVTIVAWPLGATALVCGHDVPFRFLMFCGQVSGTVVSGVAGGTTEQTFGVRAVGPLIGLGGRLGLEIPLGRVLILRVHGEAAWVPTPSTLQIDRGTNMPDLGAYHSPPFAAAGGLGALLHFP